MLEAYQLHVSEWAVQRHAELLRSCRAQRLLRQTRPEGESRPRLFQLAARWFDEWILYMGTQAQNDPDPLYPYFWSGPMGSYCSSRYRRFI